MHAFGGCSEFESGRAAALANLGFVALAADVYGKDKKGGSVQENFALMKPLVADRMGVLKKRLLAAVNAVRSLPEVDQDRVHHGDADSHIPAAAVNDFMQEQKKWDRKPTDRWTSMAMRRQRLN
ncbi:hypothetical protein OSTOST_22417 [Ostertagia ostertagi]